MAAKVRATGLPPGLVVAPGAGHDEALVRADVPRALAWLDTSLAKPAGKP